MSHAGLKEQTILDARRCSKIRNKVSGYEQVRNLDYPGDWAILYDRAIRQPGEFEVTYDADLAREVGNSYKYSEGELRPKTSRELQNIAMGLGATGEGKTQLIKNILKAQE